MALDKQKAYRSLRKKGFIDSKVHSGDHKYLVYYLDGEMIVHTKISHGGKKDLDAYLITQMAKQCKLTKSQFADLINCPMSGEQYLAILKGKNMIG